MLAILKKRLGPIGLDIGRCGIRAVQLCRTGSNPELYCAQERHYTRSQQAILNESTSSPECVESVWKESIGQVFEAGRFKGRQVILHCPSEHLDIRPLTLPCGKGGLDRETTLNALKCEMDGHLDFTIENTVFDYRIVAIDPKGKGQSMVVYSANGSWITRRIKLLESMGWQCRTVEALPCALCRLADTVTAGPLSDQDITQEPIAERQDNPQRTIPLTVIIDIAEHASTLIVADRHGPFLLRRFDPGGRGLSQAIGDTLLIESEAGESIKRFFGLQRSPEREMCTGKGGTVTLLDAMADIVARGIDMGVIPTLQDMMEGIIRTLNYVITDRCGVTLVSVYLTGGGSQLAGLPQWMSGELGIPVQTLTTPLLDQLSTWIPGGRGEPGHWTTATGLALTR